MLVSVITGLDVATVTPRDGELPLEREAALHSSTVKAMPFGCGLVVARQKGYLCTQRVPMGQAQTAPTAKP